MRAVRGTFSLIRLGWMADGIGLGMWGAIHSNTPILKDC